MSDDGKVWRVNLPFPPSVNGMFRNLSIDERSRMAAGMARKGKHGMPPPRVRSKDYLEWRKSAGVYIMLAKLPRFSKPVSVSIFLTPPDNRASDADNRAKAILDSLVTANILPDDSNRWVHELHMRWENPDDENPHAAVVISFAPHRREALSATARHELKAIQERDGLRTSANGSERPSKAIRELVAKGYLEPQPGLLDGQPQAYKVAD